MRNYEVTFIVDPVLSGDEIKSAAEIYRDLLKDEGSTIVSFEDLGLKQLAYSIKKRNSGVYYKIEFETPTGAVIPKLELSLRRDERIIRFLSVKLDKYGVKYNEDKRNGLIGKKESTIKQPEVAKAKSEPAKAKAEPAKAEAPANTEAKAAVAAAPVVAETVAASDAAPAEPKVETANVEAPVAEAPVAEAPVAEAPKVEAATEELAKIEGVGPKIQEALIAGGITTYSAMASATPEALKEIISAAGSQFNSHDTTTWPKQAQLASEGKWDELKVLQDELDGGKVVSSSEEE